MVSYHPVKYGKVNRKTPPRYYRCLRQRRYFQVAVHLSPTANHREALLSPGVLIIAHPRLLENHRHSKTEVPVFSLLCPSSNPAAEPFSQN